MFKKDVERYYKKKLREKEIKDELKELKDLLIAQLGDKEVEVKDEYTISYKPSYSYVVDEDKLVDNILKYAQTFEDKETQDKILKSIRYKMVIDEEVLESLIYNGYIPEDIGKDCTTEKETFRFMVKKNKK